LVTGQVAFRVPAFTAFLVGAGGGGAAPALGDAVATAGQARRGAALAITATATSVATGAVAIIGATDFCVSTDQARAIDRTGRGGNGGQSHARRCGRSRGARWRSVGGKRVWNAIITALSAADATTMTALASWTVGTVAAIWAIPFTDAGSANGAGGGLRNVQEADENHRGKQE